MNPPPAPSGAAAPVAPERCTATGLTKPECHCPGCLAALVARYRAPRQPFETPPD